MLNSLFWTSIFRNSSEAYSEPCETSKMDFFAKIINDFQPPNIFGKSSILDVWQGSEYLSALIKQENIELSFEIMRW